MGQYKNRDILFFNIFSFSFFFFSNLWRFESNVFSLFRKIITVRLKV